MYCAAGIKRGTMQGGLDYIFNYQFFNNGAVKEVSVEPGKEENKPATKSEESTAADTPKATEAAPDTTTTPVAS